jgi:hypothetical protein
MTAKEKANELVDKYWDVDSDVNSDAYIDKSMAIKCALIAVEEIMQFLMQASEYLAFPEQIKYWLEVKAELEKL